MDSSYTIRNALSEDAPAVFEMAQALATLQNLQSRFCVTVNSLQEMITDPEQTTTTLVGLKDNQVIAFAMYTLLKNNRLYHPGFAMYVDELFVLPDHRGAGLGTSLFKHIATQALQQNCNRLEWWIERYNMAAMVFYYNLGARPLDEFTTYRMLKPELEAFVSK